MANVEFGTGKTVLILTIVAACFAVLWPKIFYPMLVGQPPVKRPVDPSNGCCDVWFESDVDAIRVMTEMCGRVLSRPGSDQKLADAFRQGKPTPAAVSACRTQVLQICEIDIAEFLSQKARLGKSYRQILDEIRTFNTSVCLRRNFGVSLRALGAPRQMREWGPTQSRHMRQERPPHLRPEIQHPALRERGRAIPPSHIVPKAVIEKENVPKPPIPGMRPPMGGAGHVVPPPKTGGTMSIVMPLYTIGIVIFFMYTIMKVFVRKSSGDTSLHEFESDPEFRRVVFTEESSEPIRPKEPTPPIYKTPSDDTTRLGWKERDTRDIEIDHLRRRLEETEKAMERIVAQMSSLPGAIQQNINTKGILQVEESTPGDVCAAALDEEEKDLKKVDSSPETNLDEVVEEVAPRVQVLGVVTRARAEGGQEWRPPPSPILGQPPHSRPTTPLPPTPEPTNIFLEGTLPSKSQLLVEDAETEILPGNDDPTVILSGKMTLSLINVDSDLYRVQPVPPQPLLRDLEPDLDTWLDPDSTLLDVDSDVIDDTSQSLGVKNKGGTKEDKEAHGQFEDETTNYTTATMSHDDAAEAEDTAADLSVLEIADDQEDLQEEYDAIWGNLEQDENVEAEAENKKDR